MKNYFAPEVEVLDVMVEKGFAASDPQGGSGFDLGGGGNPGNIFGGDDEE